MKTTRLFTCCAYPAVAILLLSSASSAVCGAPAPDTPVSDITFVAFDTETTGFGPTQNGVLEIGAVKFRNDEILDEKEWLINPQREISWWALQTHGITQKMLKDQPVFAAMYPEFQAFISDHILLAHNAPFDVSFMREEFKRNDIPPPANPVINSLHLFRTWFPDAESHSIEPLCEKLGIKGEVFHRATADSRYIAQIIAREIKRRGDDYTYDTFQEEGGPPLYFKK
jgi:DNA polymerase III epsilon subunit family exonuclease